MSSPIPVDKVVNLSDRLFENLLLAIEYMYSTLYTHNLTMDFRSNACGKPDETLVRLRSEILAMPVVKSSDNVSSNRLVESGVYVGDCRYTQLLAKYSSTTKVRCVDKRAASP